MKKLIATLVVPALALGLASCNRSEEDRNRITLALSTQTNPFFVELRHGAQDRAKELGVPLDIQDASDDPAQQVNQLGNATSMGAKVVVVNPTDSDAVAPAVRGIKDDGVPVIGVDRDVNGVELDSMVASDNVAGGAQAADTLAHSIGENGEILILQGTAGTSASRERGKGFAEQIAKYEDIGSSASNRRISTAQRASTLPPTYCRPIRILRLSLQKTMKWRSARSKLWARAPVLRSRWWLLMAPLMASRQSKMASWKLPSPSSQQSSVPAPSNKPQRSYTVARRRRTSPSRSSPSPATM